MANGRNAAWLGITIVAIVVVAFAARSCSGPESAPSVDTKANELDPTPAATATIARDEATRREANEAPPVPPIEPWLDHPYEFTLEVQVVDSLGIPRPNVTLMLAPRDLPLNFGSAQTQVDGRCTLRWRSRSPTSEIVACIGNGALRVLPVRHDAPTRLTVCEVSTSIGAVTGPAMGLHPFATFVTEPPIVPRLPEEEDPAYSVTGFAHYGIPPTATGAVVRAIEGTTFAEDGSPACGETVSLFGATPAPLANTSSDEAGRFRFNGLEPGTYSVRAGGDRAGLGTTTAVVTNGITSTRIDLHPGSCIRGRVVLGFASAVYRIVFIARDGSWCDETWTDTDGSFVIANLPTSTGDVFAWPQQTDRLPVAFALHALADNGELLLRHDVPHARHIRLDLDAPDECKEARIEMRVWSEDSGIGAFVHPPKPDERWNVGPLAVGWYRLEARAAGCGFVDLCRVYVDGNTDVDLGRITLPRPGRVQFVIPDEVVPVKRDERVAELYEVRSDFDVRVPIDAWRAFIDAPDQIGDVPRDRPVFLPAGDYALAYRHRDRTVKFVRFTTRSGEDTVVTAQ